MNSDSTGMNSMHMNNSHHSNSRSFDPFDEAEAEAEAESSDMNMQMQMQMKNMESMEMSPPMEQPRKSMSKDLDEIIECTFISKPST